MIDVSSCEKISDENRGVNEKLWIDVNGRPALFKKTQIRDNGTHTNAHYGEAFVSEMCELLDYKCAEIEIAERNGEVGCISYSFLKEGDELVDFISLLQNVRPSFDSKKMLVPETNETYSIPLILEAFEEEAKSEEEFKALKKDFFKSCIIDSLIEHYDRNPSNISVIRNNGHITLSPMFDNGTSLNISIPRDVIKENGNDKEWFKFLREKNKSKIGVEGEKYSNYDRLLDYILSNYYEDVADFIGVIKEKLTKENIAKILGRDDYAGLDNIFKELIINKTTDNVRGLIEKSRDYENKHTIEQYMKAPNAYNNLREKVENQDLQRIIPEISDCIGLPQRNPYHIYSVSDYMFHCIEGINNIEQIARENGIKLKISDKNKSLIQWSIMFNELGKPKAREETVDANGNIRDTFRNYSEYGQEMAKDLMERLNFYETDRKIVTSLISSHQRRNLDTNSSIKRLVNEIGERNIDLYFAMKLAEIKSKNPEIEKESLLKLKVLKKKIDNIIANDNREVIKVLPLNGEQMKRFGLQGQQIGEAFNALAHFVKSNPEMYAYYKSRGHLEKYKKDISRLSQAYAREIKNREKLKQLKPKEKTMSKLELVPTDIKSEYAKTHVFGRHGKKEDAQSDDIKTLPDRIGSTMLDEVPVEYYQHIFKSVDNAFQEKIDASENGNPGRTVFAVQADRPIGTDAIVPIETVDKDAVFKTIRDVDNNGGNEVLCVIVSEKDMPKTNIAHVVMGPWGNSGKAGVYTIMWGEESPRFPSKIDENTPPNIVEAIKKDAEYWYGKGENKEGAHVMLITREAAINNIKKLKAHGYDTTRQEMAVRRFDTREKEYSPIKEAYHAKISSSAVKLPIQSSNDFAATKGGREE